MSGRVSVNVVTSRRDRKRFQRVPWLVYAPNGTRDPHWVPPLLGSERGLLGWGSHPFYDSAECATLLAERDGQPAGRVAVLINRVHNRMHDEKLGFFGFFECINDTTVARALFEAGEQWLRERGMDTVRGPVNPSLNHTCGLLLHERSEPGPPRILMTYNPPYYESLLEACGFAPSQDLYAYELSTEGVATQVERFGKAIHSVQRRADLVVRPFDPKRFRGEVETYLDIYNRSLEGTWGFAPLQPREAAHIATELRHVIVPEFAMFAEVAGKPAGAVLALLDYNQIIRKLNGRLLPFGIVRLLAGRRKINAIRAMAMTMAPEYRHSGIAVLLISSLLGPAQKWGIKDWEFSWVLESNARSRRPLEKCGMRISRTYRLYDKPIQR